jgi:hypothetical protein
MVELQPKLINSGLRVHSEVVFVQYRRLWIVWFYSRVLPNNVTLKIIKTWNLYQYYHHVSLI